MSPSMPMEQLTVAVKHSAGFESRREKLRQLIASLRKLLPSSVVLLVASDRSHSFFEGYGVQHVRLPAHANGLSAGRNALLNAVQTEYVALMDDDLILHDQSSISTLMDALRSNPAAAIAGGCMQDIEARRNSCYNLNFDVNEEGSVIRLKRARSESNRCIPVHMTHNYFVARAEVLRRFPWDARQQVMEHESFFYQLYVNSIRVLACPGATVLHNTSHAPDDAYEKQSLRAMKGAADPGQRFMQYLCKDIPDVQRFITPYYWWHCDLREVCSPHYDAEFQADGRACVPMPWDDTDDASAIFRPLVHPHHGHHLFPPILPPTEDGRSSLSTAQESGSLNVLQQLNSKCTVPLLVLILTRPNRVAQRNFQRATWLSFAWHASVRRGAHGEAMQADDDELVPWRHVFVSPRRLRNDQRLGVIYGDLVALDPSITSSDEQRRSSDGRGFADDDALPRTANGRSARGDGGEPPSLALRVAAMRWAAELPHSQFETLLIVDDETLVHVGRVWRWLMQQAAPARLCAGQPVGTTEPVRMHASDFAVFVGRLASRKLVRTYDAVSKEKTGGERALESPRGQDSQEHEGTQDGAGHTAGQWTSLGGLANAARVATGAVPNMRKLSRAQRRKHLRADVFIDQMVVHGVGHSEYEAMRWLLRSRSFLAVWENPKAFIKSDCPGCEARFFRNG
eukprot:6211960-Pleurochrysis_carterae.AAC.1